MNLGVVSRMKQFLIPLQMDMDSVLGMDVCSSSAWVSSTSGCPAGGRKHRRTLPRNAATSHERRGEGTRERLKKVMEIEPFHPGWRDGYGMRKENGDDQTHKTHNAIGAQIAQNVAGHEDGPEVSRSLSSANERIMQEIPIRFVTDQSKIHAL